ncbi:MAG: TetR/AcrR family transcriptional regulator [Janthinobacterium lividum]
MIRKCLIRKRLTREESRDLTRQRLLDAAEKLFAKKGLVATSVEDIAEAAGYTRGAFYSNFAEKNDLFIDWLRRDHERAHKELNALLSDDDLPPEQLQQRAREFYTKLNRNNECFMNWTEARLLAVRDAKFRSKLTALTVEKRGQLAQFIVYFFQRLGVPPPAAPEAIAMAFMSMAQGVQLMMLSTPQDMGADRAESVLTLFVDALMHSARFQADARTTSGG